MQTEDDVKTVRFTCEDPNVLCAALSKALLATLSTDEAGSHLDYDGRPIPLHLNDGGGWIDLSAFHGAERVILVLKLGAHGFRKLP